MSKNNFKKGRYTIIYYDVNRDLQTSYEEYIILDTILRYSNHNCYVKGITFLSTYLLWSRGTIYKYLEALKGKEHIIEEDNCYYLHEDLEERFKPLSTNPKFLKIIHEIRKEFSLSINEYSLLYLFYSYSRGSLNKATCCCKRYLETLPVTEREYYKIKNKLNKLGLINLYKGNIVSLTSKGNNLFVQEVQDKNNCSKSS